MAMLLFIAQYAWQLLLSLADSGSLFELQAETYEMRIGAAGKILYHNKQHLYLSILPTILRLFCSSTILKTLSAVL